MDARAGIIVSFFVRKGPWAGPNAESRPGDILTSTSGPTSSASKPFTVPPSRQETWVHKIAAVICTAFLLSGFSHAQMPSGGNVFFGYSYSQGNVFPHGLPAGQAGPTVNMSGWEASVEGKYLPWLGVVADLDWHYGSRSITP